MARILIIEDNQANMKLATLLLRNAGHTVSCAVAYIAKPLRYKELYDAIDTLLVKGQMPAP
jgi:CheY-like chemotaxis protein